MTIQNNSTDDSEYSEYEPTIGLEVHCELKTATKLWCGCKNSFGEQPNTLICPVCLGLPGSLPVLNKKAVEYAIRIGLALNCTVQPSIFHRKNYFYPDMPKDFQISQYDIPINTDGYVLLPDGSKVGIVRAHIEEDTGKSTHFSSSGRIHESTATLIDYNRAGIPLVEIVSAPDITSSEMAKSYVNELRNIIVATGATDGKMEEGSLRVDANVSVKKKDQIELGTRCEIKNLNSLRSLGKAIDYEIDRQIQLLNSQKKVIQQTRHFNEDLNQTVTLRTKEEAEDYRYFPEPDLVSLNPTGEWINEIKLNMPKLLIDRRQSVIELIKDSKEMSQLIGTVNTLVDQQLDTLFIETVGFGSDPTLTLKRLTNEAANSIDAAKKLNSKELAYLINLETSGKVSSTQSKAILSNLLENTSETVDSIISRLNIQSFGDKEIEQLLDNLILEKQDEFKRFVDGDDKVIQFFIGQVMKLTKGQANGKSVTKILLKKRNG
jgi:aspartyl-tRNA(Asn)/glutamyl-tRNA(Gln) amidotransferase subunit B